MKALVYTATEETELRDEPAPDPGPGEALMTDVGFTGGGRGTHQVYINGLPDHRLKDGDIVDHLVELVEAKAAEIEAAKAVEESNDPAAGVGAKTPAAAAS